MTKNWRERDYEIRTGQRRVSAADAPLVNSTGQARDGAVDAFAPSSIAPYDLFPELRGVKEAAAKLEQTLVDDKLAWLEEQIEELRNESK